MAASRIRRGRNRSSKQPAGDQADARRRQDQAPAGRAAEMLLRDHGAKDEFRARDDCVDEPELNDDRPQPGPRDELAPALGQLGDEVASLDAKRGRQVHRADQRRRDEEGDGVHGDARHRGWSARRPARRAQRHRSGSHSRPAAAARSRSASASGRHGLRDDPSRGGEEEREARSAERGEHDQLPDLGLAAE